MVTATRQKKVAFDEYALISSVCRESFYEFVKQFWSSFCHETLVLNWHIEYIANILQEVAERVFAGLPKKYDLVINVPPGTSKSSLCSVLFPAWVLTRMPNAKCICGSHTDELVLDLSRKSRDVVRSEEYQKCFGVDRVWKGKSYPAVQISKDQDTKGYWATTKGGIRFCATVGGKAVTGFHGSFLLVDDPLDPKGAMSDVKLKEANDWMTDTLPSRKTDKAVAVTILIMQRLHQDDPTGHILDSPSGAVVKHICLPATTTDKIRPRELRAEYDKRDGLLDPVRLGRSVLSEYEMKGEYSYSGQFLQNPVPAGGGLFKIQFLQYATPPDKFKRVVRSWDTAGTLQRDSSWTVGVKMAKDMDGRIWVLDVIRGRWDGFDRENLIKATARMDGKRVKILVEQQGGSSGKEVVQSTIRSLAGYNVRADKPDRNKGDKAHRAEPFAAQVKGCNVFLVKDAPWIKAYIEEMQYFPVSRFDDQIDASSMAFNDITRRIVVGGMSFK